MNYRRASHLQLQVDGLQQQLLTKDLQIAQLHRQLEAAKPPRDKEETYDGLLDDV